MNINERFTSNLIAGVDDITDLQAGLKAAGSNGPMAVGGFAGTPLQSIKNHLSVNLEKANSLASHARPTMLAYISGFTSNVSSALSALSGGKTDADFRSLDEQVKHDFAEWQALTAMVALNWIYSGAGLNLSVLSVALGSTVPVERCLLMEMDKDTNCYAHAVSKDAAGNITGGTLFYICQNGTPFALYHPSIGIVPMHTFDSSIFRGILPWFDYDESDCHKGWNFLAEPGEALAPYATDLVLSRIAAWAEKNDIPSYPQYIRSRQSDPSFRAPESLSSAQSIPGAERIDNVWPGAGTNFRTTILFCRDAAGEPCALPEIFCGRMMISFMGEGNQMVYNTPDGAKPVCFSDGMLAGYAPVPPLTSKSMELLERCALTDLTFQAEMPHGSLGAVTVSVTLKNSLAEVFTLRKTFGLDRLVQGRLPYLMLWPFVPVPRGVAFLRRYFATWADQECNLVFLKGLPIVMGVGFDFEDQGEAHDVYRRTDQDQTWTVWHSGKPFRYAKVTGKIEGETLPDLGVVIMPEYPTFEPSGFASSPVEVAVDFGTTSTVCALRSPLLPGGTQILTYQDYGRGVTCINAAAKRKIDEEHWLGKSGEPGWSMASKIFTVAQLFDRAAGDGPDWAVHMDTVQQEYYVDSRMFLISGDVLVSYATANKNSSDPLRDQHIMNDIKFDETLDPQNRYAAGAFLAGIYLHTVLFLLKQKIVPAPGKPYLKLRVSYPNEVTLNALRTNWRKAQSIVGRLLDDSLTSPITAMLNNREFCTEAESTMAYQRSVHGGAIAEIPSVVSVDIGGGTTDISISNIAKGGDVRNMSLRYAGREMVVTTLVEYFRKFSGGDVRREGAFEQLWAKKTENTSMLSRFMMLCDQAGTPADRELLSRNNSVRMIVEGLLSDGMTLSDDEETNRLLRQLITLKFILVMRLTARVVRNNLDMWDLKDGGVLPLNLSISGTSAQLVQYVFNCSMNDLGQASENSSNPNVAKCMKLLTQLFENELRGKLSANVRINLQFYIRANVADKREVAFGMLESPNENHFSAVPLGEKERKKKIDIGAMVDGIDLANLDPDQEKRKREEAQDEMKRYLIDFPDEKLDEYINGTEDVCGVMRYLLLYEKLFPVGGVGADLGLGTDINAISSLLKRSNSEQFRAKAKFAVSTNMAKYMIEDEQRPYVDELACTYLIEDMLDSAMAALQE